MLTVTIRPNKLTYNNVSAVIFDKDGTLTDSDFYWSEVIRRRTLLIQKELSIETFNFERIANSMGLDIRNNCLKEEGPIALKSRDEVILNVVDTLNQLGFSTSHEQISEIFKIVQNKFQLEAQNYIKPIDHACDFVKLCRSHRLKIALVTSDTKVNALIALKKIGIYECFDLIIGGDSGLGDKSTGKPAKHICHKLGLNPNQIIAIGDAPMDYYMALNSNLLGSILVETGQIPFNRLLELTSYSVHSLSQLSL
tara:strand:- start:880 stop:1638 length:759 start_codon:yes stop_codon:yes gene_type:complete